MKRAFKLLFLMVLAVALSLTAVACDFGNADEVEDCGEGNHVWSEGYELVSEAACGKNQTGYPICTVCGAKGETVEIYGTAIYHIWSDDYTTDTPAACGKNKTGYRVCNLCSAHEESVEIKDTALEHVWSDDYTIATEAACGVNQTGYKTCTREGCDAHDVTVDIVGTALEHEWDDEYSVSQPAACGVNAKGYNLCTREGCQAHNEEVVLDGTALDHMWSDDYTKATEAACGVNATGYKTCTREGCEAHDVTVDLDGTALDHVWSENYTTETGATCSENAKGYKTCTREGCEARDVTVEIPDSKLEHSFNAENAADTYKVANTVHDYYKSCGNCGAASDTETFTAPHVFDQKVIAEQYIRTNASATDPTSYYMSCICTIASETEYFITEYPTFTAGTGVYYTGTIHAGARYDYTEKVGFAGEDDTKTWQNVTHDAVAGNVTLSTTNCPWQPNYTPTEGKLSGSVFAMETDIYFSNFTVDTTNTDRQLAFFGFGNDGVTSNNNNLFAHFYLDIKADETGKVNSLYFREAPEVVFNVDTWYNLRMVVRDDPEDDGFKSIIDVYVNGCLVADGANAVCGKNVTSNTSLTGFTWQFRTYPGQSSDSVMMLDNTYIGIPHGDNHIYDQENTTLDGAFVEAATKDHGDLYYKSCVCGALSDTETFESTIPLFEAGNGVFYKDAGDYSGTKNNWSALVSSDFYSSDAKVNPTIDAEKGIIKQSVTIWGHTLIKNNNQQIGTKHVVETDIKFDSVNVNKDTSTQTRFAAISLTSGENGGYAKAFVRLFAHSIIENNKVTGVQISANTDKINVEKDVVYNLSLDTWYNLRIETEDIPLETGKNIKYSVYINGGLVYENIVTDQTQTALATGKLTGLALELRGDRTGGNINLDNTFMGTYVAPLELGTGVYYNNAGDYQGKKLDFAEVTDDTFSNGASSSMVSIADGVMITKWGYTYARFNLIGANVVGNKHVFETDVKFDAPAGTTLLKHFQNNAANGFDPTIGWFGFTSTADGANSKQFTQIPINALIDADGNITGIGISNTNYGTKQNGADIANTRYASLELDKWYNFRMEVEFIQGDNSVTAKASVYINGVLVTSAYAPWNAAKITDANTPIVSMGFQSRGNVNDDGMYTSADITATFDNMFYGTVPAETAAD